MNDNPPLAIYFSCFGKAIVANRSAAFDVYLEERCRRVHLKQESNPIKLIKRYSFWGLIFICGIRGPTLELTYSRQATRIICCCFCIFRMYNSLLMDAKLDSTAVFTNHRFRTEEVDWSNHFSQCALLLLLHNEKPVIGPFSLSLMDLINYKRPIGRKILPSSAFIIIILCCCRATDVHILL